MTLQEAKEKIEALFCEADMRAQEEDNSYSAGRAAAYAYAALILEKVNVNDSP